MEENLAEESAPVTWPGTTSQQLSSASLHIGPISDNIRPYFKVGHKTVEKVKLLFSIPK